MLNQWYLNWKQMAMWEMTSKGPLGDALLDTQPNVFNDPGTKAMYIGNSHSAFLFLMSMYTLSGT